MDSILKPILLASFLLSLTFLNSSSDYNYNSLVYSKCANQTQTIASHSEILSSLFQQLSAKSSHSKFFKTTAGDEKIGISGLFQCRGDLGEKECYNCVNSLSQVSNTMCKQAVAARFQLNGCYFYYETDGFGDESPKHELLHEKCSQKKAVGDGFVKVRNAAFVAMESDEELNDKGFYEMDYQFVHVMAQCEGDLFGGCDCIECIGIAVEIAQEDCGSSVSGQVYLDKCFVSYAYNPDGKQGNSYPEEEGKNGVPTGKTVAIVLGGAASLFAGFIFVKLMKSSCQKDDL